MSKPRPRPLLIGILVAMTLIPALVGHGLPTYAGPLLAQTESNFEFTFFDSKVGNKDADIVVSRFTSVTSPRFELLLTNNAAEPQQFEIDIPELPAGWRIVVDPASPVAVDGSGTEQVITLQLVIPARTAPGKKMLDIRATRLRTEGSLQTDDRKSVSVNLTLKESDTSTTRGTGCPDEPAPGPDFERALLIRVDIAELHGICSTGEQDWFKFGGVAGKYYTIDATQADVGLDLVIDLFDDQRQQLTGSDDFPFRETPTPTLKPTDTPNPTLTPSPGPTTTPTSLPDVAPAPLLPRIKSFRAPRDGTYYIRVRDASGVGGSNATYQIVVRSESYGADPVLVPEICNDRYEPDGIPQNARLIKSNETQKGHRLCPAHDADWVMFFAHAGLTYYIFTDTKPYTNVLQNSVNNSGNPVPGADTIMSLFGLNAAGLPLATSDNLKSSFDSAITLVTSIPGYYYVQIKNAGDVGDQQIQYDLKLVACLPDQTDCKRPPEGGETAFIGVVPTPASTSLGPATQLTPTAATQPSGGSRGSLDSGDAFTRLWQRNDRPVAERRATRSWLWGPTPLRQLNERYDQGAGGVRQVTYFDKGRMEINDPAGDQRSPWYITSGLLVVELITGRMQTGDSGALQRAPADIPIAGDLDDSFSPTYASFAGVTAEQAADHSGALPGTAIDRSGRLSEYSGAPRPETRLAHYVDATRHNIPQVFWNYLTTTGTIYADGGYRSGLLIDWVYVLGYPLSEPYWAKARIGGITRDVLIQPFERRVLTYTPDDPPGWQVQMGNVGRHYYQWRYNEAPPGN